MRKKMKILFSLFCVSVFAQETTENTIQDQEHVRIVYEVRLNDNFENVTSIGATEMLILMDEVVSGFEFELLIADSGKSIFRKTEPMIEDYSYIDLYRLALGFAGGDEVWYTQKSDSEKLIYKNDMDRPILLTLNEKVIWDISEETKQIGKHKATKATTTRKRGNTVELIEAWFTPELPYSFGPLGYNGLPGLILEMKNDRITYTFKTLENKDFTIEPQTELDIMGFENYYQILESRMANTKSRG